MALQAKFNQGQALHQQGKLADAERIYREILRQEPNHFDALNMLGVIALQTRHLEQAVELIGKAIALKPDDAAAYFNRGIALGNLKRPVDALASYDKAIALKPDSAEAHNNRGLALVNLKRLEDALESFDKAIALKSDYAEAHNHRGIVMGNLKRHEDALASLDKTIALKPDFADAYHNRGNALQALKRHEDALASYDTAIALKSDYAEAYINRGIALGSLKRPEDALASYDTAIALKPDYAEAYINRGIALGSLKRPEDALASYDKAIALKPDSAEAHNNRGLALRNLKRPEDALASYDKAIALKPDYANAQWDRSLCLLLMGRFEQGWLQYEWRKKRDNPIAARSYSQPLWLGEENIAGRTLFIYFEQGLGDTIQFCRYAKLAAARQAKVIMSVQQPLFGLLKQFSPTIQIIGENEVPMDFDYHCPLLSLPLAFKTTLSNIPATIPYLKSNSAKSLFWKEKLGEKNKLRIGLVWSGGFRLNQPELWSVNKRRNIPLAKLAVLKHPEIAFYSVQKGQPAESELAELIRKNWDGPCVFDFTSLLSDFSDTAALVDNLDLVISVDTSTAHLAGALGKPVWILNRFDPDWRWLLDRTDSPWYPTVKLYRQQKAGDWNDVVQRVQNGFDLTSVRSGMRSHHFDQ